MNVVQLHPVMAGLLGLMPAEQTGPAASGFTLVDGKPVPLRITPRDCVDEQDILGNVVSNMANIEERMVRCAPHGRRALIVSGGPSAKDFIAEIAERQRQGDVIFAVKHALPPLMGAGIHPDFVVILDPRPFDGVSTHGAKRKDLLSPVSDKSIYLLASMSNPGYLAHLREHGAHVVLWHAHTGTLHKANLLKPEEFMVTGGTCSAFRSVGIAWTLGFRRFTLYGFDLAWPPESVDPELVSHDGSKKYMYFQLSPEGTKYVTTGELVAAAQDGQQLFGRVARGELDGDFEVRGTGIIAEMYQRMKMDTRPPFDTTYPPSCVAHDYRVTATGLPPPVLPA